MQSWYSLSLQVSYTLVFDATNMQLSALKTYTIAAYALKEASCTESHQFQIAALAVKHHLDTLKGSECKPSTSNFLHLSRKRPVKGSSYSTPD